MVRITANGTTQISASIPADEVRSRVAIARDYGGWNINSVVRVTRKPADGVGNDNAGREDHQP